MPLDFSDDGKTLLGYTDQGGAALDLGRGRLDVRVPWPAEPRVSRVVLSADKRTMFVGRIGRRTKQVVKDGKTTSVARQTGRLDAYSLESGKKLPIFDRRSAASLYSIAVSPDGRLLAFSEANPVAADREKDPYRVVLWELATSRSTELGSYSMDLAFSPDSSQLFASDFNSATTAGALYQWTLPDPKPVTVAAAKGVAFHLPENSKDGRWMVLRRMPLDRTKPQELELLDRRANRVAGKTTQDANGLNYAVFDPNGRHLVLVDQAMGVRSLELATNKFTTVFELPKRATAWFPQFSPDGTRFAVLTHDTANSNVLSVDADSFEQPILWLADLSRPSKPERVVLPPGRSFRFLWAPDGKSLVVNSTGRFLVLDATNVNGGDPKP